MKLPKTKYITSLKDWETIQAPYTNTFEELNGVLGSFNELEE